MNSNGSSPPASDAEEQLLVIEPVIEPGRARRCKLSMQLAKPATMHQCFNFGMGILNLLVGAENIVVDICGVPDESNSNNKVITVILLVLLLAALALPNLRLKRTAGAEKSTSGAEPLSRSAILIQGSVLCAALPYIVCCFFRHWRRSHFTIAVNASFVLGLIINFIARCLVDGYQTHTSGKLLKEMKDFNLLDGHPDAGLSYAKRILQEVLHFTFSVKTPPNVTSAFEEIHKKVRRGTRQNHEWDETRENFARRINTTKGASKLLPELNCTFEVSAELPAAEGAATHQPPAAHTL